MRGFEPAARSGTDSALRILKMKRAEPMKLSASATIATGALRRSTIRPASPGRPADQDERKEDDDVERRDLEHARVQHDHGGQRQRERGELRAELADGLCRPELEKIRVSPETPFWPALHDCPLSSKGAGARSR